VAVPSGGLDSKTFSPRGPGLVRPRRNAQRGSQGRAEGVAGLDLGLQVPLRSAASTANIAECRRGSCGCSLEWSLDSRLLR